MSVHANLKRLLALGALLAACGGGIRAGNPGPTPGKADGVTVSGRIVKGAAKTEPATGYRVRLEGPDSQMQTTDRDGSFAFANVTAGTYTVKTWVPGPASSYAVSLTEVVVGGNAVRLGDLALPGALSGRVLLAGASDFTGTDVYIPGSSFLAKTDARGDYVMLGVAPGTFSLRASRYGYDDRQVDGVRVVSGEVTRVPELTLTKGNVAGVAPTLVSVSPNQVEYQNAVTLTGSNFGGLQGDGRVLIAGVAAPILAWSDTQAVITVPRGLAPGLQTVTLVRGGLTSNGVPLGIRPTLLSATPAVTGGDLLTITGVNLGTTGGTLRLNGVASATLAVSAWGPTAVTAVVPTGISAGGYGVTLTNGLADQSGKSTTVMATVLSVAPAAVTSGTGLTITGTNFGATRGTSTAQAGGAALVMASWSAEQLKASVSPYAEPGTSVVALAIGGTAATSPVTIVPYVRVLNAPYSFASTTVTLGSRIDITGTNLGAVPGEATLGGVTLTVLSWSATSLSLLVPSAPAPGSQTLTLSLGAQGVPLALPVVVDAGAPHTTLSAKPPAITTATVPSVSFTATDDTAVVSFQCAFDGGAWQTCTSPWSHAALPAGAHAFAVRAIDRGGNVESPAAAWSWTIDIVPPETQKLSGPPPITNATTVEFTFAATDDVGVDHLECRLDAAAWQVCTSPQTFAGLATDVSHTFEARAVDKAGLADTTPAAWVWRLGAIRGVAAGTSHSCAISVAGEVWCWGNNSAGQLGDGTTVNRTTPVAVPGVAGDAVTLAAGASHTCVITRAGGVKCWGANSYGQLGDGSFCWGGQTTNGCNGANGKSTPGGVVGLASGVRAIATHGDHTCALTQAGAVKCWGYNADGQLGNGTIPTGSPYSSTTPVDVVGLGAGVRALGAGMNHSCAVTSLGALQCWGNNMWGQLGDGTYVRRSAPVAVSGMTDAVVAVAATQRRTCAILGGGALKCWGSPYLGDGYGYGTPYPRAVTGLASGVVAVAAGRYHTCAAKDTGGVRCWGENGYGQLGTGAYAALATVPVAANLAGAGAVAAGDEHTCAVHDGRVACWGHDTNGQLGLGWSTNETAPRLVGNGFTQVAAGETSACAVGADGRARCWGQNDQAALGLDDLVWRNTPEPLTTTATWSAIDNRDQRGCGIQSDGSLWCWGAATNPVTLSPTRVGSATDWAAVAAGQHSCAIKTGGSLWCWGYNTYGELGDGTNTTRLAPVQVTAGTWSNVALVIGVTCGVQTNHTLWCWGQNSLGQLGDGTGAPHTLPTRVGTATDWQQVSAGTQSACAVKTTGTLWCWGVVYAATYSAGVRNLTPVQVGSATDWDYVSAGRYHACARKVNGTVWCWGSNNQGQLGTGSLTGQNAPTQESTGVVWQALRAGPSATFALRPDGSLWSWGSNSHGQLGLGTGWSLTPRGLSFY